MVRAARRSYRKGGAYTLGKQADLVTGPLRMVRNGAGNVTERETGKVIWVESEDLGTALPGDLVTIRLYRSGGESKGKVIKIVERSPRDVVGTLMSTGKFLYVVPLNPVYRKDFYVPAANGAKPGDRVVVRFTGWENRYVAPEGEVVDVIGPADLPSLDTLVVMKQFDLPEAFPAVVIDEAEKVAQRLTRPAAARTSAANTSSRWIRRRLATSTTRSRWRPMRRATACWASILRT
jgi:ribonuclease R